MNTNEREKQEAFPGSTTLSDYGRKEDNLMSKDYDGFRSGMLRAAEMARSEFKRAPEAAKGHDCVYMGGYEDACDHLSAVIAQAAVIDSVRIAGSQPDWQYHIALLLPDEGVDDTALLKVYQIVEHELRLAATQMRDKCVEKVLSMGDQWYGEAKRRGAAFSDKARLTVVIAKELESLTLEAAANSAPKDSEGDASKA